MTTSLTDLAGRQFAAVAIASRLDALVEEIPGVRRSEDVECVHRMRVASRRLRTALALFSDFLPPKEFPLWLKDVRRVTRALGAARDTDVQLEFLEDFLRRHRQREIRPGLMRLILRLKQKREKLQRRVIKALDRWEQDRTEDALRAALPHESPEESFELSPAGAAALYRRAQHSILDHWEQVMTLAPFISQPDRAEAHHALRIAVKRLRYACEVFAPLYTNRLKPFIRALKDLQEILGQLHDCDVWQVWLPSFLEEERERTVAFAGHARGFSRVVTGIEFLRKERARRRRALHRQLVNYWSELQRSRMGSRLKKTLVAGVTAASTAEMAPQ